MILCADIREDMIRLGLFSSDGHVLSRRDVRTAFDRYRTPVQNTLMEACRSLMKEAPGEVKGIGISTLGCVDFSGTVTDARDRIPGYNGIPLAGLLEKAFHLPVCALNHAQAVALGEHELGAGRGFQNVITADLGSDTGLGIILNNHLYRGTSGFAGDVGHMTLYRDGFPCPCGKRGCFHLYADPSALARRAGRISWHAVLEQAHQRNPAMLEALDAWVDDLCAGLTGLILLFNPDCLIISGPLITEDRLVLQPLRQRILSSVMSCVSDRLSILSARLGDEAALAGALRYWLECRSE